MKNMDKGLTCTKMGADKLAENTPNAPNAPLNFWPNLSAQAQKFGIYKKDLSLVVRSLCLVVWIEMEP